MGPIFLPTNEWSLIVSLLIGIFFGGILESAGFSSSRKLAGVFYGYDFTVIRVFFTAAATAAIGLGFFSYFGLIDFNTIFVNSFYIGPAILGGAIMGLGFVIGGFCPGTSMCAASIGKVDAFWFMGGMFLGVVLYDLAYPLYNDFYVSGALGRARLFESLGISQEAFIFLFVAAAVVFFGITAVIQKRVVQPSKAMNHDE